MGGAYEHVGRFAADVRTMFRVCEIFNGPASFAVRSTGATMHGEFMTQVWPAPDGLRGTERVPGMCPGAGSQAAPGS